MILSPDYPIRADQRFLYYFFKNAGLSLEERYLNLTSLLFQKIGGSWKNLLIGSGEDMEKLKKVIKFLRKKKVLKKKK